MLDSVMLIEVMIVLLENDEKNNLPASHHCAETAADVCIWKWANKNWPKFYASNCQIEQWNWIEHY